MADPEIPLERRLGWMADAVLGAKVGPKARFFTQETVDELVLLLREAEERIVKDKADKHAASYGTDCRENYALRTP